MSAAITARGAHDVRPAWNVAAALLATAVLAVLVVVAASLSASSAERAPFDNYKVIVGFDATREAVQATVDGKLAGSVAQNPRAMGQRGVEAALAALEGRSVEKRIDTGTELVTAENAAKYLR